jgi:F420-non-reducing hydrogenase small subunit
VSKKRLAVFTATGCRACENALLDIHYQVHPLTKWADIVFWPYLLGSQWEDLEMQEKVDVCFFAGAVRTEDDRKAALKLREKSQIMVACGACAAFGGMPGLGNMRSTAGHEEATSPAQDKETPALPGLESKVSSLSQVVETDYFVPGCVPTQNVLWAALQALVCGAEPHARISYSASRLPEAIAQAITSGVHPPKGSVFAGEKAVCASCSRVKEEKRFEALKRPWQLYDDNGRCLLEQGVLCQGIVTREGCGGLCTAMGFPCRGCFGKAEAVFDPGAKMVSAVSSTFDTEDAEEMAKLVEDFIDLAGTFYRYNLPTECVLKRI